MKLLRSDKQRGNVGSKCGYFDLQWIRLLRQFAEMLGSYRVTNRCEDA